MTVEFTRLDYDVDGLRKQAARVAEAPVARRLLALAFVLEGQTRAAAAKRCGMDRQTLRDWVIRYNEARVRALSDRPHGGGAQPKATPKNYRFKALASVRRCSSIPDEMRHP
jgi:transposase-like protein